MSGVDAKKLEAFTAMLEGECPAEIPYGAEEFVPKMVPPPNRLVHELVFSMFLWEASISHAMRAMGAIFDHLTDYNELRVCFPNELATIIGTRYPQSHERCERLIAGLNSISQREQELTLAPLTEMPKREARQYLAALDGVPGFVAARVTLIGLHGHAFPVDGLLMKYLAQQGVLTAPGTHDQQMARMERSIRASDTRRIYGMLEYWADHKRNTSSALDAPPPVDETSSP